MKFSRPACSVEPFEKDWIEKSLKWFEQKLGKDFIKRKEYLIPVNCQFQYSSFQRQEAVQYFIEQICSFIDFNPSLVQYKIVWGDNGLDLDAGEIPDELLLNSQNNEPPVEEFSINNAGCYEIWLDETMFSDFDHSFITLAYKLTYLKLYHQKIFTFENYYMVDYAMVLFGFGIPMANMFIRSNQWRELGFSVWEVKRTGLLNHREYGYLFALLHTYRDSGDAGWFQYLNTDTRNFLNQSLDFLKDTESTAQLRAAAGRPIKDEEVFFKKTYHKNGGLYMIAHLAHNKLEGLCTFYHQNGVLWSERIYRDGHPYTVLSNYNRFEDAVEKGSLLEGNGTLYIYKPDGNLLEIETYKNGTKIS